MPASDAGVRRVRMHSGPVGARASLDSPMHAQGPEQGPPVGPRSFSPPPLCPPGRRLPLRSRRWGRVDGANRPRPGCTSSPSVHEAPSAGHFIRPRGGCLSHRPRFHALTPTPPCSRTAVLRLQTHVSAAPDHRLPLIVLARPLQAEPHPDPCQRTGAPTAGPPGRTRIVSPAALCGQGAWVGSKCDDCANLRIPQDHNTATTPVVTVRGARAPADGGRASCQRRANPSPRLAGSMNHRPSLRGHEANHIWTKGKTLRLRTRCPRHRHVAA